ncbi:MAG TPA: hypothetical protein VGE29_08100, partial [Prosthecobacter sp.]
MFRAAVSFPLFAACSLVIVPSLARGQNGAPPPVPPAVPVPAAPGSAAPVMPVAPPLPGQLLAAPAPAPEKPLPLPPVPAAGLVPNTPLAKAQPASSTSTSGQFIVHGEELTLRSALSSKCEEFSTELRALLHDKQPWKLPVVVLLNTGEKARKADKAVSTVISQLTHGGFHMQVNVNMRPDLRPADLRKEIVRALLAERILRDQKEITSTRKLLLPDWLFLGALEAMDYRQRARPSALFAAIFKSGKIFGIEEIIEASASDIEDALSKTIYQTSCCALVMALLDQPDSGLRMDKFLNSLANDPRSERELLNHWFPGFASTEASLNKWWALQLATLANPGVAEPLSPQDTVAALEEALTFHYEAKASEVPRSTRRVPLVPKEAPPSPVPDHAPVAAVHRPSPERERSVTKTEDEPPAPAPAEEQAKEKRGFMSRLNPFAKAKTSDDEIAAAIDEAAKAEARSQTPGADLPPAATAAVEQAPPSASAPAPAASASQGRKPLFDRWFGDEEKAKTGTEDKAETAAAPKENEKPTQAESKAPAPAKPADAAPAAAPAVTKVKEKEKSKPKETPPVVPAAPSTAEEPPKEDGKKPSNLNPLNWFKGGKKDKAPDATPAGPETEPAKAPEKDKKAFNQLNSDPLLDQLLAGQPVVGMIAQEVAVEADKPAVPGKKGFLGIFGKKKAEKDAAEVEAPQKPASEPAAKPAAASKPAPAPTAAPKPAAAPKPVAESPPAAPAEEEAAPAASNKAKRQTLKLNLFGDGKKEKEEAAQEKPAEDSAMPEEQAKPASPPPAEVPKKQESAPPQESPEEEPAKTAGKPKRQTLRLNLFGSDKKDESPEEPKESAPEPEMATATPAPSTPPPAAPEPPARPRPKPAPAKTAASSKNDEIVKASISVEDYAAISKRKDLAKIMEPNVNSLVALQSRSS